MPLDTIERADLVSGTRYELFRAQPSLDELKRMWQVWAVIAALSAAACGIVVVSIFCSAIARASAFSLYVAFVLLPDLIFSFLCCITCSTNAAAGHYTSDWMCTSSTL